MATAETARIYRRAARKVVIIAVLFAVLAVVGLRNAGYSVLIGGGATGETRGELVLLNCRYFTGTEKVINRLWKKAEDAKAGCPVLGRFADLSPSLGGEAVTAPTPSSDTP